MKDYDGIRNALQAVDPCACEVKMVIRTLDPDYPYPLHWDVTLDTSAYSRGGFSRDKLAEFFYNFNDYFLGVDVTDQKIDEEAKNHYNV